MKRLKITLFVLLFLNPLLLCAQVIESDTAGADRTKFVCTNGAAGTTLNRIAKFSGAPSKCVNATTSDTTGLSGITVLQAGTTGNAWIQRFGLVFCDFDGATVAGDWVQASVTTGGKCHDAGSSQPGSGDMLGWVLSTNAGGAGTYDMFLDVLPSNGGAPLASPTFTGTVTVPSGTGTNEGIKFAGGGGLWQDDTKRINFSNDTNTSYAFDANAGVFRMSNTEAFAWSNSSTNANTNLDTCISRSAAKVVRLDGNSVCSDGLGSLQAQAFLTTGNCASSGGTCAGASAGAVSIAAAATTVTVSTTAVTANSQIFVTEDSTLGTRLSVTCNTTTGRVYTVTTRTAGTSFIITASAAPTTNPACLNYHIVN